MDNVLIGQKDMYHWSYDFLSPLVYLPKIDAVLITRYFVRNKMTEEHVINNFMIALFHESLHETLCKLIGENESRAFDKVPDFNTEIEKWLGWHYNV